MEMDHFSISCYLFRFCKPALQAFCIKLNTTLSQTKFHNGALLNNWLKDGFWGKRFRWVSNLKLARHFF